MEFQKANLITFVGFAVGALILFSGAVMAGVGNSKFPHRDYNPRFDGSRENYLEEKKTGKALAVAGYIFIAIGGITLVTSMVFRCRFIAGGFLSDYKTTPGVTTHNAGVVYTGPAAGGYQASYPQDPGPGYPPPSTYPPTTYPSYPNPSGPGKLCLHVVLKRLVHEVPPYYVNNCLDIFICLNFSIS